MIRIPTTRSMAGVFILTALASFGVGCANGEFRFNDPVGREKALEEIQKEYTNMVRWNEFDDAAQFVHPESREQFMLDAPGEDLRFTDAESKNIEIDAELAKATIEVKYLAYRRNSPYEYEVKESQEWIREGNDWKVRPTFEGLRRAAGKPASKSESESKSE